MEVKEITKKDVWEDFFVGQKEKTFLQSWNWGEFQQKMGNKIWRLGIFNNGNLIEIALVTKFKTRRGIFLLIQHLLESDKQALEILLEKLKKIGKEENASFIRIAPLWIKNEENRKTFRDLGFKEASMHANAYEATWKLDITFPEEDLLQKMRKTTRYLIRQAQKNNDIEIIQSQKIEDVDIFNKLLREVAKTRHFVPFSSKHPKNEFSVFVDNNQISLFFGKHKGEIVAGAFVIFWNNIAFYHHAALLFQYHKLPIAYLLQWEAIKEAKNRGCKVYDFWGYTDPKKYPKHPWAGPTLFKMGFRGNSTEYLKTQDFPISKKYWLIYIFETLRKLKRRL
ncbi:lipid II:glycine glycyltransferase FemX [Patescibacteria group bacterium]